MHAHIRRDATYYEVPDAAVAQQELEVCVRERGAAGFVDYELEVSGVVSSFGDRGKFRDDIVTRAAADELAAEGWVGRWVPDAGVGGVETRAQVLTGGEG